MEQFLGQRSTGRRHSALLPPGTRIVQPMRVETEVATALDAAMLFLS
jgi:hypothetical protein